MNPMAWIYFFVISTFLISELKYFIGGHEKLIVRVIQLSWYNKKINIFENKILL